jgi:hypothetical protein
MVPEAIGHILKQSSRSIRYTHCPYYIRLVCTAVLVFGRRRLSLLEKV